MVDLYRLKALRETDERKETLYKIVSETTELKSDFIRETETDEEPRYSESQTIIRETVEDNESIQDLSRLERFKEWVKKNGIALGGVMIGITGIITAISISARNAIKKGTKTTDRLAKTIYNLGKKLSPILVSLFNILANIVRWGVKGLTWLASNLWVLVLAFA